MGIELRPTPIAGCFEVVTPLFRDERGMFTRAISEPDLEQLGAPFRTSQANIARSTFAGTVRGIHAQRAPHGEAKFVRCAKGAAFDVAVDLREHSPTFGQWHAVTITADNGLGLLVPRGCAHGYQALEDDTTLVYFADNPYAPEAEIIVSPVHEELSIAWPLAPAHLSAKDAAASATEPLPHL